MRQNQIGAFYAVETTIRAAGLTGPPKCAYRIQHTRPLVEAFFAWVEDQFVHQGLLPSNPLTEALAYVRERRAALSVFLDDAEVQIDTNHLERALRHSHGSAGLAVLLHRGRRAPRWRRPLPHRHLSTARYRSV